MLHRFFIAILVNLLIFIVLNYFGVVQLFPQWQVYLEGAFVLSVLNSLLKPVLKFLSFPLLLMTVGLFSLVINALILWITDMLVQGLTLPSFSSLIIATVVFSLLNMLVHGVEAVEK